MMPGPADTRTRNEAPFPYNLPPWRKPRRASPPNGLWHAVVRPGGKMGGGTPQASMNGGRA